jgi:lysozyme
MAFNLGIGGLLEFHTLLACLLKQDWHDAAAAMLNSKWAEQVGRRVEDLAAIITDGSLAALLLPARPR